MKHIPPKVIILVVYKSGTDGWRGFCAPYDVTCNASTKRKAMQTLEELVELYQDGLKKYHYPKHLSIKSLSNREDAKVFNIVREHIAEKITKKLKDRFFEFESEQEKKNTFKVNNLNLIGRYYFPESICNMSV